jgi:Tfp pilus assembly protein PilF
MRGALLTAMIGLSACAGPRVGPYSAPGGAERRTSAAEQLTKQAAELVLDDPQGAEKLLREALTEDLFFGPAHNNLGVVFLERGDLYEAATEFEWARKLMPGHPDPRLNLAITLDRAGQMDEALNTYSAALEVYPGHIGAVQGLARLAVREGHADARLDGWLGRIALEGETQEWRQWAAGELASSVSQ